MGGGTIKSSESIILKQNLVDLGQGSDQKMKQGLESGLIPLSRGGGKYIRDNKVKQEIKTELGKYIEGKVVIKEVRLRIRDNTSKGFAVRARVERVNEDEAVVIKVTNFLRGAFCKERKITRFSLMTATGGNALSCDVNAKEARCFKGVSSKGLASSDVTEAEDFDFVEAIVKEDKENEENKEEPSSSMDTAGDTDENDDGKFDMDDNVAPEVGGNGDEPVVEKYVKEKEFIEETEAELAKYLGENCVIKDLKIRIRDNVAKGFTVRVRIEKEDEMKIEEIKVSDFLKGDYCKAKHISRFCLMTDKGDNSLSCDVNAKGVRCYTVMNGPPVELRVNWWNKADDEMEENLDEKDKILTGAEVQFEIGVHTMKVVEMNGAFEDEIGENEEVRVCGRSLAEAVDDAIKMEAMNSMLEFLGKK